MKTHIVAILFTAVSCLSLRAQGTILFDNNVPGLVHGSAVGAGKGWVAQLGLLPREFGASITPLFPTTTFIPAEEIPGYFGDPGWVRPVVVTVPGIPPGETIGVAMRLFREEGSFFEPEVQSESQVTLGGDGAPPGLLLDLYPLDIPEASTVSLLVFGGLLLGSRFWRDIRRRWQS